MTYRDMKKEFNLNNLRKLIDISTDQGPMMALAQVAYNAQIQPLHQWFVESYFGFDLDQPYTMEIVKIDVDKITHNERFPFDLRGPHAVVGQGRGDWDRMAHKFTDQRLYGSLEMRYKDGVAWEDTPQYQYAKKNIEKGRRAWSSNTMIELQKKCEKVDYLYNSMKNEGYQPQPHDDWDKSFRGVQIPDEIRVAVSRNGNFIRCASGRHRLAIAKLINIQFIYAIVQIKHNYFDKELNTIGTITVKN